MKLASIQACQINTFSQSVFQVQLLNVGLLCLINAYFQPYDTRVNYRTELIGSYAASYLNNSQTVRIHADTNNTTHKHRKKDDVILTLTPARAREEGGRGLLSTW